MSNVFEFKFDPEIFSKFRGAAYLVLITICNTDLQTAIL